MQSVSWILAAFSRRVATEKGKRKTARCKNYHLTNEDPFGNVWLLPREGDTRGERVKEAATEREGERSCLAGVQQVWTIFLNFLFPAVLSAENVNSSIIQRDIDLAQLKYTGGICFSEWYVRSLFSRQFLGRKLEKKNVETKIVKLISVMWEMFVRERELNIILGF